MKCFDAKREGIEMLFFIIIILIGIIIHSCVGTKNASTSDDKGDMSSYDKGMLDGFSGTPTEKIGDDFDYDQGFFAGMSEADRDV